MLAPPKSLGSAEGFFCASSSWTCHESRWSGLAGPPGTFATHTHFYPLREVGISRVAIAQNSDISATCLLGLYCSVNSHGRIQDLHSSPASSSGRVCTAINQFAKPNHNQTCASEMAPQPIFYQAQINIDFFLQLQTQVQLRFEPGPSVLQGECLNHQTTKLGFNIKMCKTRLRTENSQFSGGARYFDFILIQTKS